jgi:hypothetical protein
MAGLVSRDDADQYRFQPGVPTTLDVLEDGLRARDYPMASSPDLATLKIDDFVAHLDTDFEMQVAGVVVPLKLVKIDPAGNSGRAGGAFSLIFVAPIGSAHKQAMYPVRHPVLGNLEIFLVPVGPQSGGLGYQAIFT